jgi:hypothetical protein
MKTPYLRIRRSAVFILEIQLDELSGRQTECKVWRCIPRRHARKDVGDTVRCPVIDRDREGAIARRVGGMKNKQALGIYCNWYPRQHKGRQRVLRLAAQTPTHLTCVSRAPDCLLDPGHVEDATPLVLGFETKSLLITPTRRFGQHTHNSFGFGNSVSLSD